MQKETLHAFSTQLYGIYSMHTAERGMVQFTHSEETPPCPPPLQESAAGQFIHSEDILRSIWYFESTQNGLHTTTPGI